MKEVTLRCGRCAIDLNDSYLCNRYDCNYKDKNGDPIINQKNPDDLIILQSETYKDAFPGLNSEEIIWSQHQLILNLKKEIFDLKQQMTGHLISVHY